MANDTTRNRQGGPAEDPLAELARLMGQEDEFADLLRQAQTARPAARPASAAAPASASAAPAPAAARPPLPPRPASTRPSAPPPSAPLSGAGSAPARPAPPTSFSALAADVFAETQRRPAPAPRSSLEEAARDLNRSMVRPERSAPRPPEPRAESYAAPRAPASRGHEEEIGDSAADAISRALSQPFNLTDDSGYDEPRAAARPATRGEQAPPAWMARTAPAPAPARDTPSADEAYDYGRSADADEGYDEEEFVEQNYQIEGDEQARSGRRRILLVASIVALAGVGTCIGYVLVANKRGSVIASGDTPVIHAEQGPNKIVPSPATPEPATDGQKLIYDRVGGSAPTGNERVVSSEEQPVDVSQAAQPQPRVIQPAPSPSAQPANATEPKRVRTLTVRADGTIVEDATPSPVPPGSAPTVQSSAQPTASAPIPLSTGTGAPAPTSPTPLAATPSIVPNAPNPPARVAAAPAPAPAATSAAPAPAGAYVVQIASVRSEAEAQATWRSMQSKYPGVLNGQSMAVRRADLGDRGIYYRAQVGSFANREDANALCQALRAQGGDCMVQRN